MDSTPPPPPDGSNDVPSPTDNPAADPSAAFGLLEGPPDPRTEAFLDPDDFVVAPDEPVHLDQPEAAEVDGAGAEVPSAVAVVVLRSDRPEVRAGLESLDAQDYPNLEVLVVSLGPDAPSADVIAECVPAAYVQVSGAATKGAAINEAAKLVKGASFFVLVDEAVELDAHCVTALVEEVYRSNAAMCGPKVLVGGDQRRLAHVGMGADRFGGVVDLVEPGEFDQEQYDNVRDVFVLPPAVQLVRADLFRALNGVDEAMDSPGLGLDLSWRVQVAGGRVMVVPSARAAVHPPPDDPDAREAIRARNRFRTVAVTAQRGSTFTAVIPTGALLLAESGYNLLAGRPGHARGAFGAVVWNARRWPDVRAHRRQLQEVRRVPDSDIRRLQVSSGSRIRRALDSRRTAGADRLVDWSRAVQESFAGRSSGELRDALLIMTLGLVMLVFGSRHMITRGVEPVGEFPIMTSAGSLFTQWISPWREAGMGGQASAPPAFALLGLARVLFFWGTGLLSTLLIIGPLFVGPIGVFRLAQPLRSPRSAAIGALAYIVNPLPLAAISTGRWSALFLWGLAPFMMRTILEVQGATPYGTAGGPSGPSIRPRPLAGSLTKLTLLVGFGVAFVPATLLVATSLVVAVILGSIAASRPTGLDRLVLSVPVFAAGAIALQGLFGYEILAARSWDWLVGNPSPVQTFDSMADLLRFAPGDPAPSLLTAGLLVTAGAALVVGRADRFDVAAKGWAAIVVAAFVVWVDRRGWISVPLPAAEVMLSGAAVGLSLAVATGVRSLESDLSTYRFGWRQGAAVAAALGMVVAVVGGARSTLSGDWNAPHGSYLASIPVMADNLAIDDARAVRVLWLSDPAVAALAVEQSEGGVWFGTTVGGAVDVTDRWLPRPIGITPSIGDALDLATTNQTTRLGRLLAHYGVTMIVVTPSLAAAPYDGPELSAGANIEEVLEQQLDLRRIPGTPDLMVYEIVTSAGIASDVGETDPSAALPDEQILDNTAEWEPVPMVRVGHGRIEVGPSVGPTLVGYSSEGWELEDGTPLGGGFGDRLMLGATAEPTVVRQPLSVLRIVGLIIQVVLVGMGLQVLRQQRRSNGEVGA